MRTLFLAVLLLGSSAFAADTYTSVYTDMEKDCENAFPEEDAAPGSDIPARCKGPGGNSIYEYFSGMDSYRMIELASGSDPVALRPDISCNRVVYGKKMEWRLRNTSPIALIYRATCYVGTVTSNPHEAKDRTGEYLVVQPLSQAAPFATIDVRKTKNANEAARKKAEEIR